VTDGRIPIEITAFLRDQIQTYEQLEILVSIGRDPASEHLIAALVRDLNLDSTAGAAVVDQLSAAGLLTITHDAAGDTVRCQEDFRTLVAHLAEVYEADRIQLISEMTQNALERVRNAALRTFSSAFLLGKKRDG
jgi:DNA-binding MarR family transcriptional regulator